MLYYYIGSTIAAHGPPSIDPGLDWWKVAWGCNSRGTLSYKGSTIAAHGPPSIDPGSDQWRGGMGDTTIEACQQEVALGKQWRLAMQHTQHWVGQRGNNRHLSHVAAPQDRR